MHGVGVGEVLAVTFGFREVIRVEQVRREQRDV
jgi:hypothetical protein